MVFAQNFFGSEIILVEQFFWLEKLSEIVENIFWLTFIFWLEKLFG
jgi:hypothetical protein